MPYPYGRLPSYQDLIDRLTAEYGCTLKTLEEGVLQDETGDSFVVDIAGAAHEETTETFSVHYLERIVDGRAVRCSIVLTSADATLAPTVLRSILKRLKIEPAEFSLVKG